MARDRVPSAAVLVSPSGACRSSSGKLAPADLGKDLDPGKGRELDGFLGPNASYVFVLVSLELC